MADKSEKKVKMINLVGYAAKGCIYQQFDEFKPEEGLTKKDIVQLKNMRRIVPEDDEELVRAIKLKKERDGRAAEAKKAAEDAGRLPGVK